jgi:hypothetical protein
MDRAPLNGRPDIEARYETAHPQTPKHPKGKRGQSLQSVMPCNTQLGLLWGGGVKPQFGYWIVAVTASDTTKVDGLGKEADSHESVQGREREPMEYDEPPRKQPLARLQNEVRGWRARQGRYVGRYHAGSVRFAVGVVICIATRGECHVG